MLVVEEGVEVDAGRETVVVPSEAVVTVPPSTAAVAPVSFFLRLSGSFTSTGTPCGFSRAACAAAELGVGRVQDSGGTLSTGGDAGPRLGGCKPSLQASVLGGKLRGLVLPLSVGVVLRHLGLRVGDLIAEASRCPSGASSAPPRSLPAFFSPQLVRRVSVSIQNSNVERYNICALISPEKYLAVLTPHRRIDSVHPPSRFALCWPKTSWRFASV